jgi:hypothetical protein
MYIQINFWGGTSIVNVTAMNKRRQKGHLVKCDGAKLKDIAVTKECQSRLETRCQNHELMKELASDNSICFNENGSCSSLYANRWQMRSLTHQDRAGGREQVWFLCLRFSTDELWLLWCWAVLLYLLKLYGFSHSSSCRASARLSLRFIETLTFYGRVGVLHCDGMWEVLVGSRVAALALNQTVHSFVMLMMGVICNRNHYPRQVTCSSVLRTSRLVARPLSRQEDATWYIKGLNWFVCLDNSVL